MRTRLLIAWFLVLASAPALRAQEAPVTRADALTWLSAVERVYAREDMPGLLALTGAESLQRMVKNQVGRLFEDRNYLKVKTELLDFTPRGDGTVEILFLEVMRSRPVDARSDVREKARRRLRLQRRDGAVVVIDALDADEPKLPDVGVWSAELWTGSVELVPQPSVPFGSPEGEARVSLRVRLRNLSPAAATRVEFGLHPFVRGLSLSLVGGPVVSVERHQGAADAWRLELPEPVEAGAAIELELDYTLDEVGEGSNARIGADGAHLFSESAWFPVFSPTIVPGADRASHDFTVVVPPNWTAVMPGELTNEERLADGRRALRWVSRFPGEALVVVAGELELGKLRLSDNLSVETWLQPGAGPVPPKLVAALQSMTAHYERRLGPAPVDRFTLVQSLAAGQRAQPAFMVIDDLDLMDAELYRRRRERQPLFYLAHQLTHLWLQDGVRPIGGPAQILTEGLCDHLTFGWMDAEIDDQISVWHRDRILHLARAKPASDRPILVTHPGARDHDVFGAGKTLVVLDGFRSFAGPERWDGLLRDYVQGQRGRQVGVGEMLAAFGDGDARLESYVSSWIIGEGLADIAVHAPTAREVVDTETGAVTYEVELVLENLGLGPVPVLLRTLEDELGAPWHEEQLELGSMERTVLRYRLANPLRMVEVDPRLVTWQSAIGNDNHPVRKRKPKTFPGEHRKVTPDEQARLEKLLKD